ncbi:ATP-binding protein [Roseovarius sp. Pro17]|uniref:ATP-binding protein n=1 Tax=Roseovarius sp. Pro17 TaxID=3108175 RepID=UPI003A7F4A8C
MHYVHGSEANRFAAPKRPQRTSVAITTNLSFGHWRCQMTAALLDRMVHRCHILQIGDDKSLANRATTEYALTSGIWAGVANGPKLPWAPVRSQHDTAPAADARLT